MIHKKTAKWLNSSLEELKKVKMEFSLFMFDTSKEKYETNKSDKEMRNKIFLLLKAINDIIIILLLWLILTTTVQRFFCKHISEKERFYLIPNNLILKFRNC